MGDLFNNLWKGAKDSIESPLDVGKNLLKGDFGEAFDSLKAMPGNQERANSDILNSVGIRGWVGDHPGETAGAIAGSIFGGMAALGGGAAGTAAGTGSAMAYAPTSATVLGGTGSTGGTSLGLGTWGTSGTSGLLGTGTGTAGFGTGAGMTYAPTASSTLTSAAGEAAGLTGPSAGATDWGNLLQQIGSLGSNEEQQQPMSVPTVRPKGYQGKRVQTAYEQAMSNLANSPSPISKNKFM